MSVKHYDKTNKQTITTYWDLKKKFKYEKTWNAAELNW